MDGIEKMVELGWRLYTGKVASELYLPENEKMMQLQLALIYQSLAPLFECNRNESIKVLLEVPRKSCEQDRHNIDIVIERTMPSLDERIAIELKCFRHLVRGRTGKRGAQNLGLYDYWKDIENIEACLALADFTAAYQFTLTDDSYYAEAPHKGSQVATYSTARCRKGVTGVLLHPIANRPGKIHLRGSYDMDTWSKEGNFYFILQRASN